jgi:hypothetical protein
MPAKDIEEAALHERAAILCPQAYEDAVIEYKKAIAVDRCRIILNRLALFIIKARTAGS